MIRELTLSMVLVLISVPAVNAQSQTFSLNEGREWEMQDAPEPDSDAWTVSEARRLIADGRAARAERNLTHFLDATKRTDTPLRAEALLARADARTAQGREYSALYDYEEVIREYPGSPSFARAIERELDISIHYLHGKKRVFLKVFWLDATDVAIELLIRTQERLPGGQLAERAAIELADHYYSTREVELAAQSYELYIVNFPNGPNVRKAARRRIYADVARFKGPQYDTSRLIDAQVRIRRFARDYPAEAERTGLNQALINRLDDSMGAQLLEAAQWYLKTSEDAAARHVLRRLLRDYPDSTAARRAEAIMTDHEWAIELERTQLTPVEETTPDAIHLEDPVDAVPESTAPTSEDPSK